MTPASSNQFNQEYGNDARILVRGALFGLCTGAFAVTAGLVGRHFNLSRGPVGMGDVIALLFAPAVFVLVGIAPTVLLHIRIKAGCIQHVFAGRWVLSDLPVADFLHIRPNRRGCAAVLYFTHDRKIHFFGARISQMSRLTQDLMRIRRSALTSSP